MSKRVQVIIIAAVFVLAVILISVYYYTQPFSNTNIKNPVTEIPSEDYEYDIPTEGNNTVFKTTVDTSIRVINEYDASLFTSKKNLLIMFSSWCPNCEEEISEIEKILNYYENSKNVNVIVIAHEFKDTVSDLFELIEKEVEFGKIEVFLDLGRVIRKKIDPEASTIPISYVIDKKGNVLEKHDGSLTLEKAKELVQE